MVINLEDIIGFTKAPDGACFVNVRGFMQVIVSPDEWSRLREAKLQ